MGLVIRAQAASLLFACACGAVNAMAVGAHAGVKSEEQVLAFMEEQQRI